MKLTEAQEMRKLIDGLKPQINESQTDILNGLVKELDALVSKIDYEVLIYWGEGNPKLYRSTSKLKASAKNFTSIVRKMDR